MNEIVPVTTISVKEVRLFYCYLSLLIKGWSRLARLRKLASRKC